MNDKELLALAAKAAGHRVHPRGRSDGAFVILDNADGAYTWSPLTDDGDALRLAIDLKLPIKDGLNGTIETGNSESGRPIWELYGSDPYAATRRAIVRAAAEIGRSIISR